MALWPFGKNKAPERPTFVFTDTDAGRKAFFKLQCKYGDTGIEKGKGMIAMVLDPRDEFPEIPHPVKIEPDGRQLALIKVISHDGGFTVTATTPSDKGDRLVPGDVVVWVPFAYHNMDQLGTLPDKRIGWVGLIRAKVRWMAMGTSGPFDLSCRYD
jgi:hypothetical protein